MKCWNKCPKSDTKIIIGDFNAKVGRETAFIPSIGAESLHDESNENGVRMIDFAAENGLVVRSTCFKHKK
jgi:hypothetical protein